MSDLFDGWVLVGAKTSPTNAASSAPADSGVSREVGAVPPLLYPAGQPALVQVRPDQYRAAILAGAVTQEEYLVWAANTGSILTVEDPSWVVTSGTGAVTSGDLAVYDANRSSGQVSDGSPRVVVTDTGGRDLAGVLSFDVVRGDDSTHTVYTLTGGGLDFTFDVTSGVAVLHATANVLAATLPVDVSAPALSAQRGDRVVGVAYWLAETRFWWTKNDSYATRFGWNGAKSKWLPYRGGSPKNLGPLQAGSGSLYTLSPLPAAVVGAYLPGSSAGDAYAAVRLGVTPDAGSYPVVERVAGDFSGLLVVPDDLADASYNFALTSPPLAGVVSVASGVVTWNPALVSTYAGLTVWYSPSVYEGKSSGVVGTLLSAQTEALFIAPIPSPTERPIIRLGNRAPLIVILFDTESDLLASFVLEGEVGVALSTGRVSLSAADITKADPGTRAVPNAGFDKLYFGAVVRYDGVTGNLYPQPLRAPTHLVDGAGNPVTSFDPSSEVFIPDASGVLALGTSGIINLPDGTGNVPDAAFAPTPRPTSAGLVRALSSGLGDTTVFTSGRAVETLITVSFEDELPTDPYRVSGSTAYVALEKRAGLGSKVVFGSAVAKQLAGKPLYFKQAEFVPSSYATVARLVSRKLGGFSLVGTETLAFRMAGVDVSWSAAALGAGTFSASQVAASLDAAITAAGAGGSAYALSERLVLADDDLILGSVSIGFTTPDGCSALGFMPGWFASPPGDTSSRDVNWIPDYGGEFGVYRSPRNLDSSQNVPDYRDKYRLTDQVLAQSVTGTVFQFLDFSPREDIAGYDDGVFFALSASGGAGKVPTFKKPLLPWSSVQYRFEDSKFAWLSERSFQGQVQSPVASIDLGAMGVLSDSLLAALGGYFRISPKGGPFVYLEPDNGLLLVGGGNTGEALLVDPVGSVRLLGYRGRFNTGDLTLTDSSANFSAVVVGDVLQVLSGGATGSYTVTGVTSSTVAITPAFLTGDGGQAISYRIRAGCVPGAINPAVVADAVYEDFNPLPVEPFDVRVLTVLGVAGGTLAPAQAAKSVERGRAIFARFTQTGTDLPLAVLGSQVLGGLANDVLTVPNTGARFSVGAFSVLVGTVEYVNGADLLPVPVFSSDPGSTVEYLDATTATPGLLRFGSAVFASVGGASVTYVERGLPPASLPSGGAEIDPDTGVVYLSLADLTQFAGQPVYFVEQLSCEGTTDMVVNPVLGSFTFLANPIQAGQLVEAAYYQAVPNTGALYLDSTGNPVRVKEFLPVYVRAETATRITANVYAFNPTGRTVDQLVAPMVYEDAKAQTYGVPAGCSVDFATNRVSFVSLVPTTATVTITYAVYEAGGGETAYTSSIVPVWRPPLRIDAGKTQFALEGDRTSDLGVGRLFRLGAFVTYVRGFAYNATSDVTVVTVFPAPKLTAGSLDTGANALSLLTDRAVTPVIDPFGPSPTPVVGVDTGFLVEMATAFGVPSTPSFEPVASGQVEIKFDGDLTHYAVAGHVVELLGYPFVIVKAQLASDGRTTTVSLGSPFPSEFKWSATLPTTAARISVRPVYPAGAGVFLGNNPFVTTEPTETVLYGERDGTGRALPGRTLALGTDYSVNPANGSLTFLAPRQAGIAANQSLQFYRTDSISVAPFVYQGQVQYPRAAASFAFVDAPSTTNGRIGGVLQGTYTFDSSDAFYARAVPFTSFVGEVSLELQRAATAQEPSFGPTVSSGAPPVSSAQGRLGLASERSNLVDRDRVARAFLSFYNGVTSSLEQIEETLSGSLVGERDGKLRLFVGKNDPWTPPGYEDAITGAVNPRVLWFSAFDAARRGLPVIRLLRTDPITDPRQTSLDSNGRPQGPVQDPSSFAGLLGLQDELIRNDLDDVVLVSRGRVTRSLAGFIWFKVRASGNYASLSEASPFSRIFPERTTAFTTTAPGLDFNEASGDPGAYSAGSLGFDPLGFLYGFPFRFRATTGTAIGTLANPVLGTVQNVLGVQARDRLARARVWAYSETGFPEVDPLSAGLPCFLATPLPLADFPLLSDSGLPDTSQLASQSLTPVPTGKNDLETGDPDLHTPPFTVGDQLALGVPSGSYTQLGDTGTSFPVGLPPVPPLRYGGVFVKAVLSGCILTLADESGAVITTASRIIALSGAASGTPISPQRGDTVFAVPKTGANLLVSDPPTVAQLAQLSMGLPSYRTGTDLDFNARTGELIDATLPSFADPTLFGLKEITGQRPPAPLSTLEAKVSFQNGDRLPVRFPALSGGTTLDSGDYSLPYYGSPVTELELLGSASATLIDLTHTDSIDPPPATPPQITPVYAVEAVYPDETLGADGAVLISGDPSTLTTNEDLLRGTASGAYPPPPGHAGVGDVQPFDLVLIQEGSGTPGPAGFPAGATGIHTVGGLLAPGPVAQIEPPRFACAVTEQSSLEYAVSNCIAWVDYPAYASGMVVRETVVGPLVATEFIAAVAPGNIVFDDGAGGGVFPNPVGGLNDVVAWAGQGTQFLVQLIDKVTGTFPFSTLVNKLNGPLPPVPIRNPAQVFEVSLGGPPTPVNMSGFYFLSDRVVVVTAIPFFNFAAYPSITPSPGVTETLGFHDFSCSVLVKASYTASIDGDRLTWRDHIDFRSALPRGYTHPAGSPGSDMACALSTGIHALTVFNPGTVEVGTTLNSITALNAGVPFTFPARTWLTPSLNGVGTFTPAPSPSDLGTLRVSGFEGRGNVPIEATAVTFSAVPSSRQSASGPIFNGLMIVGQVPDAFPATYPFVRDNRFLPFGSPLAGSLTEIQAGDIVVIKGLVDPSLAPPGTNAASGKCGTYLVRAAVEPTVLTPGHRLDLTAPVGSAGTWLDFVFPTVVSLDSGPHLTVSSLLPLPAVLDVVSAPVAAPFAFAASGRVYLIVNDADVTVAANTVSASYTALDGLTNRFLNLAGFQDGNGAAITLAQFQAAAVAGVRVSGMTFVPVSPYSSLGVPPNLPGITLPAALLVPPSPVGGSYYFGFRAVSGAYNGGAPVSYDAGLGQLVGMAPAPGELAVYQKAKLAATGFLPVDAPVYDEVPGVLDLTQFDWATLHGAGNPACLFPGDVFDLQYHAVQGIFVEPSFPTSGNDLGLPRVNVVDAANSLTVGEVGTRDFASYSTATPPLGGSLYEFAQVEVRRIRRFHDLLSTAANSLRALRFVYEIRRGIVQSLTTTGTASALVALPVDTQRIPQPLAGGQATQLGGFSLPDVNVNGGDTVRFLDANGAVFAAVSVLSVEADGVTLNLSKRVITGVVPGTRFEVFLQKAPVPHEQSCAELFELVADRVLIERHADLTAQSGGTVAYLAGPDLPTRYALSVNQLTDTDTALDFAALGIQAGDVLVIDPAGDLRGPSGSHTPLERGRRPFGDDGVIDRIADPGVYAAGGPSQIDDNRGFYRVTSVTSTSLGVTVLGGALAGGLLSGDVVFDASYAVYPTVHGSSLSGAGNGVEGQMDLRPTAFCDGSDSFRGNWLSIAPFSYTVIRPTGFLSEETIELILSMRERLLSWMEELRTLFESGKSGSYFVFQRDEHIADLGDPTDPELGLGVLFDAYIESVGGRVDVSPFANTSDCLSVLDRRFWGLDFRLDSLKPPFTTPLTPPYSEFANGVGRPVLPDRIEEALEQRDKLRDNRWAWLTSRTDRVTGTIEAVRRFDHERPRRLAEQKRLLAMVKGTQTR